MKNFCNAKAVFDYLYEEATVSEIYMAELLSLIKYGCDNIETNKGSKEVGEDLVSLLRVLLGKGGFMLYKNIDNDGIIKNEHILFWRELLGSGIFDEIDDAKAKEIEFKYSLILKDREHIPFFDENDFESIHLD